MSFSDKFKECIQSINECVNDIGFIQKYRAIEIVHAAYDMVRHERNYGIEINPMNLTTLIQVPSHSDLFLGIYNDTDDLIEFDVIIGVNTTLSKMTCNPHSFTPALANQTFVPLVALAYHRTSLKMLSSVPEKRTDCFLVYGFLECSRRIEFMKGGWKVTPENGEKTIYGHRGTAGYDPQDLCYVEEEKNNATFRELPRLK